MAGKKTKTVAERFWAKVDVRGEDECWPWFGGNGGNGYGRFRSDTEVTRPHVFSLELKLGRPLGEGMVTRHTCDFRKCCDPKHLIEGTPAQNIEDAKSRNRNSAGRGERHRSAKLTEEDIRYIRNSKLSNTQLAEHFGVVQHTISNVRTGVTWRHVL